VSISGNVNPGVIPVVQYALIVAFRVLSETPTRNRKSATCRGCGAHLIKGSGQEVIVQLRVVGRTAPYYLCEECFGMVARAHELDARIDGREF
jgi:hypothetical protein